MQAAAERYLANVTAFQC